MGTKNALTEKVYSGKDIMRIAYPILISLLMEQMIGMTDTAFLGRVGEVELGAAAIAGIYYLAVFMMGFGFGVGAQILIARRNGEKHYDEIGEIFIRVFISCWVGFVRFPAHQNHFSVFVAGLLCRRLISVRLLSVI